jgi:hypothetical protein
MTRDHMRGFAGTYGLASDGKPPVGLELSR